MIVCDICNKTFSTKYTLARHKLQLHDGNQETSVKDEADSNGSDDSAKSEAETNSDEGSTSVLDYKDKKQREHSTNHTISEYDTDDGNQETSIKDEPDEPDPAESEAETNSDEDSTSVESSSKLLYKTQREHSTDHTLSGYDTDADVPSSSTDRKKLKRCTSSQLDSASTSESDSDFLAKKKKYVSTKGEFTLFTAYKIKHNLFIHLEEYFGGSDILKEALKENEFYLVNAIVSTASLDELCRLLNDNLGLVTGICKTVSKISDHF